MADPFFGEIRIFAGLRIPKDWVECNGQLLAISENQALFALVGTCYGGDGVSTFAVPDLRGRVAVGSGQGTGLQKYDIGQTFGAEHVTLTTNTSPTHSHPFVVTKTPATSLAPSSDPDHPRNDMMLATPADGSYLYAVVDQTGATSVTLNTDAVVACGGSVAHDNVMPVLPIRYIICCNGYFPSFS